MFNILVVEDDKELRELFSTVLVENGYNAFAAEDGVSAFDVLESNFIDLVICDIMMPRMDGYELTKELRRNDYDIPILMITALGGAADKKEGFKAGTDDYMVKPIDVDEMLWRVEALLRRAKVASQRKLQLGSTFLDCDTLTVKTAEGEEELPQKEFFLLYKLLTSLGRIFTRRQIMDDIWGVDNEADSHTLDVHISRLRERFKDNTDFEIVTVRGLGYKAVKR